MWRHAANRTGGLPGNTDSFWAGSMCVCVLLLSGPPYSSDHINLVLLKMSMGTPGIMATTLLVNAPSCVRYCNTSILYRNMSIMSRNTSPICCITSTICCITSALGHKTVNIMLLQMSMWTAGIVVMTLLVNAPLIPLLLKWTGLSQVSPVKAKIRAKAGRAFTRYTQNAVKELKNDEDEMLRGASPVGFRTASYFVSNNTILYCLFSCDGIAGTTSS